jgi:hypothetical protein
MIRFMLTLFSFLIVYTLGAQTSVSTVNADFVKNVIQINGVSFTNTSTLADYEKVLGKAERVEKVAGKDKYYAYDALGLSLVLKANTNLVQEVYVTYVFDGDRKVAKGTYQGKLLVNSTNISTKTSHDEISKITKLDLKMVMKGLYMGQGKGLALMVYYPEATIAQLAFSF